MTALAAVLIALAALGVLVGAALVWRRRAARALHRPRGDRRILVPFTGGALDAAVLDAAIRVARAEQAVLVPAYLLIVPLEYPEDAPRMRDVAAAAPNLEAIEHAARRAGVPVDARVETGRTPTHALRRLWQAEVFYRLIAPAPAQTGRGLSPKDLAWILAHAPMETLVLKPAPNAV